MTRFRRFLRHNARLATDDRAYLNVIALFAMSRQEKNEKLRKSREKRVAARLAEITKIKNGNMIKVMSMRANLIAWQRDPSVTIKTPGIAEYVKNLRDLEEELGLDVDPNGP